MKLKRTWLSILAIALITVGVISCKDDFTEQDLVSQQNNLKKTVSASDSLQFLLKMTEFKYKKYLDSLSRKDSIDVATGKLTYLPYTYEVQVVDGSVTTQAGGKTQGFATDVVVTITQYGVKQTATSKDGLFSFKNIGVGVIHGSIVSNGYTTFEWQVDSTLPYELFKESTATLPGAVGGAGGANGTGGTGGTTSWYLNNPYALKELLKYYNNRSFGNSFAIFATSGASANTVTGRAFIETNLTNRVKEVVPAGTAISAYIDMSNAAFITRFVTSDPTKLVVAPTTPVTADISATLVNSVFNPRNYAYTFLGATTTDASGDYTITLPASPDGIVPIKFEYSDVVANKTFFSESNGDVSAITRRNIYGPSFAASTLPTISTAPTVGFIAGSGATATATVSGNGSVSDIDLTAGGQDYQGTPRVWFSLPPAGGTQATATATVTGGVVTGVTIVNAGSGYTSAPTITITEGSGATASSQLVATSTNGGVANVRVDNAGSMSFVPNVVFYYDLNLNGSMQSNESIDITNFPTAATDAGGNVGVGTTYPAATAVLNTAGNGLGSITVGTVGAGLPSAPSVAITSGAFATATVTITAGAVTATTIPVGGGGKYYLPGVTLTIPSAGTPTTASVLTPTITAGVISAIGFTAGAGYPVADGTYAIVFTPKSVGTAAASAVWQGQSVGGINVTGAGTAAGDGKFYTNVPKVNISLPQFTGTGSKVAVATAVLGQDGRLVGVNVTDAGFGYTSAPTITIVSGINAAATAKFADKAVQEIAVTAGGSGYIVAPSVLIVDFTKSGTGATATAKITNGVVTSITLTAPGTGYINGAAVIILDPGTTYDNNAATANTANSGRKANVAVGNVIVQNGVVTGVEIQRAGDNYPAGTEVKFISTRGTGAVATVTAASGKISAVNVTAGGTQYTGNNYFKSLTTGTDTPNVNDPAGSYTVGLAFTTDPSTTPYLAKSGVKRVIDIHYGTGANRD
jgi:hypothetical protein